MSATYTPEQRAEAVALYAEVGPSEVETQLGVPKSTVTEWAKAKGVRTVRNERTEAATQAAMVSRKAALAERLHTVAERAVERELELIDEASLRDVVGARTRAIHDLQLLSGEATQRTEVSSRDELQRLADELDALVQEAS